MKRSSNKRPNRSRSGGNTECPHCHKRLRGKKGLKMHVAQEHKNQPTNPEEPL